MKGGELVRVTSTPLASIFGSGFLIIVPILAGAVGIWSVAAMAGVCSFAFAVGSVIRHNIRHVEPVLTDKPPEVTLSLERASDLALVLAYVVSVCLYLHILSGFILGGLGDDTPGHEDLLTSVVIAAIVAVGTTRGLQGLDVLEEWSLYITLLIIVLLLAGFAFYDWTTWASGAGFIAPEPRPHSAWEVLTIMAGTLIVVQGFETTRYLEEEFPAAARVQASRWSQILASAVYLVFVAAALPMLHTLEGDYTDNSLIRLAGTASSLLVAPLVVAAALSQFSAAVADTVAAAGDLEDITHEHLSVRWGSALVGGGALALTWSSSTFELVAIASRAFAFYYLLQCLVALTVARNTALKLGISAVALVLVFITLFAVPAG